MASLDTLLQNLWMAYSNGNSQAFDIESKPLIHVLDGLNSIDRFAEIYDYQICIQSLHGQFDEFLSLGKNRLSDTDCNDVVEQTHEDLRANIAEHWIIVPLNKDQLDKTIKLRNFVFISGSREEKIVILKKLSKINANEANWRASHTENSRSKSQFGSMLIGVGNRNRVYQQ